MKVITTPPEKLVQGGEGRFGMNKRTIWKNALICILMLGFILSASTAIEDEELNPSKGQMS